jgi:sugar diacid utilization regulator
VHDFEVPRKRQRNPAVTERLETAVVVQPFLASIANWQQRLARARIRKVAASSTSVDRVEARLALGELMEEVQHARRVFEAAIVGHGMRGRISDVRAALERLAESIAAELR